MEFILDEQLTKVSRKKNENVNTDNGEAAAPAGDVDDRIIIHLVSSKKAKDMLNKLDIPSDELKPQSVTFNKVEAEQDFFSGTLFILNAADVTKKRSKVIFFVNRKDILFINDDGYVKEILMKLRKKYIRQNETREKFLSMFLSEIISRDVYILDGYERRLMEMEETALEMQDEDFLVKMLEIRKCLLTLRGYYEQLSDIGKNLEENENSVFLKKQVKYFGTFSDRAERLLRRTVHLLDYANQVKDLYQSQVTAKQNRNMQYLTVVSTIFFPLTLITGWYGMNFENMPELAHGYPAVIALSIIVVVLCIFIFKKKKIL